MIETRDHFLPGLRQIALEAGAVIMNIYQGDIAVRTKSDESQVTEADEAAEAVILAGLAELAPEIPVIAEESVAAGRIPEIGDGPFWLVDPLDGTKEFISKNGEFTVNVALIEDGSPTHGVVFAPAVGQLYLAAPDGATIEKEGAAAQPIAVRRPAADGLVVVASRSHRDAKTDDYLADFNVKSLTSAGSSLKLCLVAAGEADLYPRLGRTMEWDIAAGHAVLAAAGGSVETLEGAPMRYGKSGFENPFFVARGG